MADVRTREEWLASDQIDKDLFRMVKKDDPVAFNLFVRRNQSKMAAQIKGRMYDHSEIDAVLWRLFTQLYRRKNQFRGDSKLYTWVFSVMINMVKTQNRKTLRARGQWVEPKEPAPVPTSDTMRRRLDHSRAALELPVALRTAWVLRYVRKLSVRETAACLDTSTLAVRQRCYRANQQIGERQ